jgi:hypothetical protein
MLGQDCAQRGGSEPAAADHEHYGVRSGRVPLFYPVIGTFAYSGERQAAYAAPPFLAPTPPGAPPVKALRARLDVVQRGHG